mmetsp:Transcript_4860/g.13827  ORF Transcript_4860/g.13827 Transcript_4860/m.13827 type:complete len:113 (-) Transcript_4860:1629-1967(-)
MGFESPHFFHNASSASPLSTSLVSLTHASLSCVSMSCDASNIFRAYLELAAFDKKGIHFKPATTFCGMLVLVASRLFPLFSDSLSRPPLVVLAVLSPPTRRACSLSVVCMAS